MDHRKLTYFAALNFLIPALAYYLPASLVINLTLLDISFPHLEGMVDITLWDKIFMVALSATLFLLPIGLVLLSYHICRRTKSWKIRLATIYASWLILAAVSGYIISSAILGVSMAVADGGLSGWELEKQNLEFVGGWLLVGQIIIIPAAALTNWYMKKKPETYF